MCADVEKYVTDNPINQTILSTFMTKRKIKYDVAKNGEEAVMKWQTGGFHLILVSMSGLCHAEQIFTSIIKF